LFDSDFQAGKTLAPVKDERPHAVVIGSGFGGLAAAVRLGARGYRVTVLERLATPGGRARVLLRDGYTFDAGPTIITAPFLFEELWALCGRRFADDIDLRALSPFYRVRFDDGQVFDCSGDPHEMRARVAALAPADVDGYERFMALAERICALGFEKLGHVPFSRFTDMLRVAPQMVLLGSHRSVYGLVSRYVKNPRLRFLLSFHPLFVGGNPFTVTSIYSLIAFLERRWGVHFAMGGTGKLVSGLVDLIQGQGNHVRLGAEVQSITVEAGVATGVRLASGEAVRADIVVSNADARAGAAPLERAPGRECPLFDGALRLVFRHAPTVPGGAASHHSRRAPLPGPARRHLRPQGARRGLQPVPAPTNGNRSLAGTGGLRVVLCAFAGAQPRRQCRLEGDGRAVPPAHRPASGSDPAAGPLRGAHGLGDGHPAGFSRRSALAQGRRFQPRTGIDPERLVSPT
jgi:phytoene dehydrogenase-like protein